MKITKAQLSQVIKEELAVLMKEESSAEVDRVVSNMLQRDMKREELELLRMKLDDMIRQLSAEEEGHGSGRDKVYDDEEREAKLAGASQSMSPEEQEDYMKLYNLDEGMLDAIKNKLSPKRPAATKAPRDRRERNEHEKKAARQQGGADAYDFNRGMLEKPNRPNDEDYMAGWNSALQEGTNTMKITKSKLAQIIKEELQAVTTEGMDTLEAHMLGREHAVEVWRGEREDSDIMMMSNAAYRAGFEDATAEIAAEEGEDSLHRDPSHDYDDDSHEEYEDYDDDGMWENKITKSKLAQIVQEELSAVKAEGYKAYNRDDDERIYPKRTLSRHAKDVAKNIKKGYSLKAAASAIPDNEKVDKAYYDSLSKKPKRESQLSESDVDPIEAGQDEGIQEFIYQQIADNLQDGPLPADSILSLTEPEYESPREHLADQWEDILAAALHEMSEGDDATIEKSHDTMTGEPYYSPIGFLS
jgi:hypothetical protein